MNNISPNPWMNDTALWDCCAMVEGCCSVVWKNWIIAIIIPDVKIVSRDWLTKVGYSIMSTGEMSTGKTSISLTGSTGSRCCFHWYFTQLGFVRYNKTNMPCQCGSSDGMSPLGRMVFPRAEPSGKPSSLWARFWLLTGPVTGIATITCLPWSIPSINLS